MKGIAIMIFGACMFLLGIFSAVMLAGVSDWILWGILIIAGLIVGLTAAIGGLVSALQEFKSKDKTDPPQD